MFARRPMAALMRLLPAVLLSLSLAAFAPSAFAAGWPQFRYSAAHTGFNPSETGLSPSSAPSLAPACSAPVESPQSQSPTIVGRRVFLQANYGSWPPPASAKIYALDARSCAVIWSANTGFADSRGFSDRGGLAYSKGLLFATTAIESMVRAFDAADGTVRWTATTQGWVETAPVVAGNRVFVADTSGVLYAFDAATGATLWTKGSQAAGSQAHVGVANGIVYVAGTSAVKAFQTGTGKQLWTHQLPYVNAPPAVQDGKVYVTTCTTLYALDSVTGKELWRFAVGRWGPSAPALAYGRVYTSDAADGLYALDAATGELLWTVPLGGVTRERPDAVAWTAPVVANRVVLAPTTDGALYAANATTGAVLWKGEVGGGIRGSASVTAGSVFIGSANDGAGLQRFAVG